MYMYVATQQQLNSFKQCYLTVIILCPIGWGCRISAERQDNECPVYDTKSPEGESPVLEL